METTGLGEGISAYPPADVPRPGREGRENTRFSHALSRLRGFLFHWKLFAPQLDARPTLILNLDI